MHDDEDKTIPEEGDEDERGDYAVPGDGDVSLEDDPLLRDNSL